MASHVHLSCYVSSQLGNLVGDEAVGEAQRQALQGGFCVDSAFVLRIVGSCQQHHFVAVLRDNAIDVVCAIGVGQVNGIQTNIAHLSLFVCEIAHVGVNKHAHRLLVLYQVEVASQHTANGRHIRNDTGEFAQVEVVDR